MAKTGIGGETNPENPSPEQAESHEIPLSEEVIWKARAEDAESKLALCEAQIAELQGQLAAASEAMVSTQRRGDIERELTAARAVDLETACLLTEATIGEMDDPDVVAAVRELKARKPFLFAGGLGGASGGATTGSSMSAHAGDPVGGLGRLASSARSSGDRNELLRYLRARRGG